MLSKDILESVVFIYDGADAALDQSHPNHDLGGSGWLVGMPWKTNPHWAHVYVVTNKHVICRSDFPVVRVNRKNDEPDVFPFSLPADWHFHGSADLAIHRIELTQEHQFKYEGRNRFLTSEHIEKYAFGEGDSVFSVGRFVNFTGQPENRPVVRFGRVAMMSPATIDDEELLLVEMRSRTGYSGSPVWIYIDPVATRWARGNENTRIDIGSPSIGPFLLGVHSIQLFGEGPDSEDDAMGAQTGMTGTVPIEKLEELLNMPKVKEEREQVEKDNPPKGQYESAITEENQSDAKRDEILKRMLETPPSPRK